MIVPCRIRLSFDCAEGRKQVREVVSKMTYIRSTTTLQRVTCAWTMIPWSSLLTINNSLNNVNTNSYCSRNYL